MLNAIKEFEELFNQYNMQITIPKIEQVLSVKDLCNLVPQHHGWIIGDDPANAEVLQQGKQGNLKAAVKWGVGVDNIDFKRAAELKIPIINTPGMFNAEVADLAICYLIGLARDAFLIDRNIRNGFWYKPAGTSLKGKTLGIVGLGGIGQSIAIRAAAHEMNVIGWDPAISSALPEVIDSIHIWPNKLEDVDFLVFACSLNKHTEKMFSKSIFRHIKPGLKLINISRGGLVDESSLIQALERGIVSSAAMDVFEKEPISKDNPLINFPSCILGSHNASNTKEAVMRTSIEAINILKEFLNE
jgi:D-3-phosphoglycerate dehydrogenase